MSCARSDSRRIDFYLDFLSPYSYLANYRLCQIGREQEAEIAYHAIDLAQAKIAVGNVGPSNRDMPVKLSYLRTDLARWARIYDIPFAFIPNYNSRQLNTGLYYPEARGREGEYVDAAFSVTWAVGGAPDSLHALTAVANQLRWNASEFLEFVDSSSGASRYQQATSDAIARHIFGVPTMCVNEEIWWGNDRLFLLEKFLQKETTT